MGGELYVGRKFALAFYVLQRGRNAVAILSMVYTCFGLVTYEDHTWKRVVTPQRAMLSS